MENVKKFIQEFAEAEFEANKNKYNKNLDDKTKKDINEKPKAFLHSILSFLSFGGHFSDLDPDLPDEIQQLALNHEFRVRALFQIRKYQNPECGEKAKNSLKSDTIYCCYMGGDDDEDEPSSLARNFYVAETDEGLKIIYYTFFNCDHWKPLNDYKPTQFTSPGVLLETYDFEKPEDEMSIKELGI